MNSCDFVLKCCAHVGYGGLEMRNVWLPCVNMEFNQCLANCVHAQFMMFCKGFHHVSAINVDALRHNSSDKHLFKLNIMGKGNALNCLVLY